MTVYCLTITTWAPYDPDGLCRHFYGRIHWLDKEDYHKFYDTTCKVNGEQTIGHLSEQSCIKAARKWFKLHANQNCDVLIIGTWSLAGWADWYPYRLLEGQLEEA